MARRVADLRAAFEVLTGPTWRDPAGLRLGEPARRGRADLAEQLPQVNHALSAHRLVLYAAVFPAADYPAPGRRVRIALGRCAIGFGEPGPDVHLDGPRRRRGVGKISPTSTSGAAD